MLSEFHGKHYNHRELDRDRWVARGEGREGTEGRGRDKCVCMYRR